jgi:hypothetical protein
MSRSRSSFDLTGAIASVRSLTGGSAKQPEPSRIPSQFEGVALVSFGAGEAGAQSAPRTAGRTLPPDPIRGTPPPPRPPPSDVADADTMEAVPDAARPAPPKLPDLSAIVSPILRCEKIVEWIAQATGATDVFLADGAGLALAGAVYQAEAHLAGAGAVATTVAGLAAALPRALAPLFEMHVGEGPFFQLIGFQTGAALYLVGLTRDTPLTPRQAQAVRLACRHALGPTLQGAP